MKIFSVEHTKRENWLCQNPLCCFRQSSAFQIPEMLVLPLVQCVGVEHSWAWGQAEMMLWHQLMMRPGGLSSNPAEKV